MRKTALQNQLTWNSYSSNGKQTAERLLIYQVLRCFRVVSSQFWAFSKCLFAVETTTNNQQVKRSLYRLLNVNNLPKDILYSHVRDLPISLRIVQFYRSCWTPRIHVFEFINISDHSRLINSNILHRKSLIFLLRFKGFRFNKLEISVSEAVTTQLWIGLWNAE